MAGLALAAALFAAAVAPSPAPAPTGVPEAPLKEIGRVRAVSPFCLQIREAVAPAFANIVQNDYTLVTGERIFLKLGLDLGDLRTRLERVPSVNIAIVRLSAAADSIRRNADAASDLISRLPDPAPDDVVRMGDQTNADEKELGEIKRQLAGIIAVQQAQSMELFEVADTMRLGQMRIDIVKISSAITVSPNDIVNREVAGNSEFTAAQLQALTPPGAPFYQSGNLRGYISDVQMLDSTQFGRTIYDTVGLNLATVQAKTLRYEDWTGNSVLADIRARCSGNGAAPQPYAVP